MPETVQEIKYKIYPVNEQKCFRKGHNSFTQGKHSVQKYKIKQKTFKRLSRFVLKTFNLLVVDTQCSPVLTASW